MNPDEKRLRQPRWEREELILVLNLYFQYESGRTPQKRDPEVSDLSKVLRQRRELSSESSNLSLRSPNSVYLKLMNFRSIDDEMQGLENSGLGNVSRDDRAIWDEFGGDIKKLTDALEQITLNSPSASRAWIFQGNPDYFEVDDYLYSKWRERNPILWSTPTFRNEVKTGDTGYFWRAAGGNKGARGVIAVGVVVAEPRERETDSVINYKEPGGGDPFKTELVLKEVRLTPAEGMILDTELKSSTAFHDHKIITSPQGTVFKLNENQAMLLDAKWNGATPPPIELAASTINERMYLEGRKSIVTHVRTERDSRLAKEAKRCFRERHGRLFCEVCGFDFEECYGDIGKDFIEAHHLTPLTQLSSAGFSTVDDLAMLCANCHRMVHSGREVLTLAELKKRLRLKN